MDAHLSLGFSRGLGDGKLPFSLFVLILSRRWDMAMIGTSPHARSRRVADATSSSGSIPSPNSTSSESQKSDAPSQHEIKLVFKKLCQRYLKLRRPPPDKEMQALWKMRDYVDVEDIFANGETKSV